MDKKRRKEILKNYDDGSTKDENGIKTYVVNQSNVYTTCMGLGKPYCSWVDADWDIIKKRLDKVYYDKGPEALANFFNKTLGDIVKVKSEKN